MADLRFTERRVFEELFEMGGGFVCDFSNRTFAEFVVDATGIDIRHQKYEANGTSKANRLRTFWQLEDNRVVAKLLDEMFNYDETGWVQPNSASPADKEALLAKGREIIERLKGGSTIEDIDALDSEGADPIATALARAIQESVEKGRPEEALDRLHTWLTRWVRKLCLGHSLPCDKKTPLHALFGSYVRFLRESGLVESKATLKILGSSIQVLDRLNPVRNDQSLAHDNELLDRNEATLIFRHISSSVKFIQALEEKIQETKLAEETDWEEPDFSDEERAALEDRWIQGQVDEMRER